MIDWNKYKPGQKFELKIVEGDNTYFIKTNLDEYEWAPNRTPLLAIISVLLRLPFVVSVPNKGASKSTSISKLILYLNVILKRI